MDLPPGSRHRTLSTARMPSSTLRSAQLWFIDIACRTYGRSRPAEYGRRDTRMSPFSEFHRTCPVITVTPP
jgi:hypothetical protein